MQVAIDSGSWYGETLRMERDEPISAWAERVGLDWGYLTSPVSYNVSHESLSPVYSQFAGKRVVMRSDTKAPLSIVSEGYHIVQPQAALDLMSRMVDNHGFEMWAAGILQGGAIVWALARTGQALDMGNGDLTYQYYLIRTNVTTKASTQVVLTSIRPNCWNMFNYIFDQEGEGTISIPHSQEFSVNQVLHEQGYIVDSWMAFQEEADKMASTKLSQIDAMAAIIEIFGDPEKPFDKQRNKRAMQTVNNLYNGAGIDSRLPSTNGTAWGLLQSVTQYVDHMATERKQGGRTVSAWTGPGRAIKQKAGQVIDSIL